MIVKTILIVFGFFLAVLGLCELIHTIRLGIISKGRDLDLVTVINLKKEDYLCKLYHLREQNLWQGDYFAKYIIVIADELSQEELYIAEKYCRNNHFLITSKNDLDRIMQTLLNGGEQYGKQ